MNITSVKENLTGMLHSGTLSKVRNFEAACERSANIVLANLDPIETERTASLAQVIHDDLNNYPLPSDFKKIIDLYPQDNRTSLDSAVRGYAERFGLEVAIKNKRLTIEGSEGSKFLRVNWKSVSPKTFHSMNSLTSDGTWSVVGSATGLKINELYKLTGSASIEFDVVASGDGIQNTGITALDLTEWDELADVIFPVYLGSVSAITSITAIWGNDLTAKYWTGVAQTAQADGTAFKIGWNWIKFQWSAATETGTVDPATIDSFKLTIQATGVITNARVDNIVFSLGRVFDVKYYSKYLFKNSSGTFLSRPTSDDDTVIGDGDLNNIFLYELLKACAHQIEGEDSSFDINFANQNLHGNPNSPDPIMRMGLYAHYRSENPSQSKKAVTSYSSGPRFR